MSDFAHDWTDEQIEALRRRYRKAYAKAERQMREKLSTFLEDFERENEDWQEGVRSGRVKDSEYRQWLNDQTMNRKWLSGMVDSLSQDAVETDRLANRLLNDDIPRIVTENANMAAFEVESGAGWSSHSFDLVDEDTIRRLMSEDNELLPKVPKPKFDNGRDLRWNRQKLNGAITQSILQGESIPHAAERLGRVMRMNEGAAIRAARTAITGAENAGRVYSYKRAKRLGINLEQQWMATLDKRTRHSHRLLDGQHVPVGEKFKVDGVELEFPGDPSAPGEYVWNCRCTLVAWSPTMEDDDPARNSKLPKGISYDDWKAGKTAEKERKNDKQRS